MKFPSERRLEERVTMSIAVGGGIGAVAGTVGTIWGGYELGSVVNDYLQITGMMGRAAIALVAMGRVAGPVYSLTVGMGVLGGTVTGFLYDFIKDFVKKK